MRLLEYATERFEAELVRDEIFKCAYNMGDEHHKKLIKVIFTGALIVMLKDMVAKEFIFAEDGGKIKVSYKPEDLL